MQPSEVLTCEWIYAMVQNATQSSSRHSARRAAFTAWSEAASSTTEMKAWPSMDMLPRLPFKTVLSRSLPQLFQVSQLLKHLAVTQLRSKVRSNSSSSTIWVSRTTSPSSGKESRTKTSAKSSSLLIRSPSSRIHSFHSLHRWLITRPTLIISPCKQAW